MKVLRRSFGSRWGAVCCLVAFVLQTGFVTFAAHQTTRSVAGNGWAVIEICTGFGIQRIVRGDAPTDDDNEPQAPIYCPLCPVAGTDLIESSPPRERPFAYQSIVLPTSQQTRPMADVACATPLPARGPPLL
ncbi:MAG: hypothetical protein AAFY56_13060 [Pseudomonadota bacterium]